MSDIQLLHERFLDHAVALKGYSPTTIREMKRSFRAFTDFSSIEDVRIWNFQSVEDWIIHHKVHSKWSAKTIHNYLGYLSQFADWCIQRNHITVNPVAQVPRPKLPHKEPEYLTETQCEALLDWTRCIKFLYHYEKPRAIAIIAMFISTGIRKSELINLKLDDVDLESMCVRVKEGKGRKDRTIPFHPSLARILEKYLNERTRLNRQTSSWMMGSVLLPPGTKPLRMTVPFLREKLSPCRTSKSMVLPSNCLSNSDCEIGSFL